MPLVARAWSNNDPVIYLAYVIAYREAKKEARIRMARARHRYWCRVNRAKLRQYARLHTKRRRALKRGAPVSGLTEEQWEKIKSAFEHRCAYCGEPRPLTQDHLTPISKNGSHTLANIVPACVPCNSRKGTGRVLKAVQRLLLL
jgi:5-methylcytosine-specific restriction endonuclease McrA